MSNASSRQKKHHHLLTPFIEPYARYQYANVLHALRLGLTIMVALLFNAISGVGHGEWTLITVFIVLGLLKYQGAIFTKATERIVGTVYGIVIGLMLNGMFEYGLHAIPLLYYGLIGAVSSVIGYFTIKNLGYMGLLTGITMSMMIGDVSGMAIAGGINHEGMMRVINVFVGTFICLLATFILPLRATLMWRFLLANNMQACSEVYAGIHEHIANKSITEQVDKPSAYLPKTLSADDIPADSRQRPFETPLSTPVSAQLTQRLARINERLLAVRGHIDATAKESKIDKKTLEKIQKTHRNIIGTIDLLLTATPKLATLPLGDDNHELFVHYQRELKQAMEHLADLLKHPNQAQVRPITRILISEYPYIAETPFDWQGYFWLTQTLQQQLQTLSELLANTKDKWYFASGARYQRREYKRAKNMGMDANIDV